MKKNFALTVFFLFVISLSVSSQIENEIKNYVDSTEILMNNGRKFLAKSIREGNIPKSKEVFHYLMKIGEERNCQTFTFNEQMLLNIIFRDWETLKMMFEQFGNSNNYTCYRGLEPVEDAIFSEYRKNPPKLESKTDSAISPEDRAVFKVLFHLLENGSKNDEYNSLITSFKKQYPNSKYKSFVKNYLPEASVKGSIGYYLAPKYSILSGSFSNYFNNPLSFAFSMDFCISKVYVSMYMEGGPMKLTQPITLVKKNGESHAFTTGDMFNNLNIGFKTGYYVLRNKKFHIAPYATLLGGGFLESNLYENDNNNEYDIYNNLTPGVGINFEYKLGSYNSKNAFGYMNNTAGLGYFSIKIDAGFITIPTFKDATQLNGNITYLSLGLVWAVGDF